MNLLVVQVVVVEVEVLTLAAVVVMVKQAEYTVLVGLAADKAQSTLQAELVVVV
jgi:hypothetical protein